MPKEVHLEYQSARTREIVALLRQVCELRTQLQAANEEMNILAIQSRWLIFLSFMTYSIVLVILQNLHYLIS